MVEHLITLISVAGFIFAWIIVLYFTYTVSYSFILSVAGYFYKLPTVDEKKPKRKIAVFIPAYKEDEVILEVARKATHHNYPKDKFDVVVIADSLRKETLEKLGLIERLILVKVDFEISTKVKALNKALNKIDGHYDIGVILDADNVMQDDFLNEVSAYFNEDHQAIQGRRMAKNKNSNMAVLDGLSEAINNHIYREGTSALGLSCSFIGSGMAIEYNLMKSTLSEMESVGGFDREMEVRLIGKGHKVHYLKSAIILDEKVENTKVFANQRRRWIFSQYHYLFKELKPGIKKLFRGDFVYFNSSVLRNIQLPRLINIGLLFVIVIGSLLMPELMGFPTLVWLALLTILTLSNVIAVPRSFYTKDLLIALLSLPKVFFIMFLLLFRLRGANKSFIHTPHNKNTNE